jgi:hypothetical protein
MRVLLTHHFSIEYGPAGAFCRDLAQILLSRGHEVRLLTIGGPSQCDDLPLHAIGVNQSGHRRTLPFDVPYFGLEPVGPLTFEQLTVEQIHEYRDVLRHVLDEYVMDFNPQIVHAQHAWLWAQLALESGVPYVLTVWGAELVTRARDERYRLFADQAVENASRIFVADEHVRREVLDTFEDVAQQTVLMPDRVDDVVATMLLDQYESVLDERFGT